MKMRHAALAFTFSLALGACDGTTEGGSTCQASCSETGNNVLALQTWAAAGRDLSLAGDTNWAPTSAPFSQALRDRWDSVVNLKKYSALVDSDLSRILRDWASRTPVATGWTVVSSSNSVMTPLTGTTQLVRFSVDGIQQGGLVWIPNTSGSHPVVLVGHPGDGGVDDEIAYLFGTLVGTSNLGGGSVNLDKVILVFPAYRGENASLGSDTVKSDESTISPWDRDVDDGLAMLQSVLDRVPGADASRISAIGFSRGAGVSLISALRDARIKSVFDIAGPTDFFCSSIQRVSFAIAANVPVDLPGVNYLGKRYVAPFWNGAISADSIRTALLRRSVARMAASRVLPKVESVQGLNDSTVFPEHMRHLALADSRVDTLPVAGMSHTSWMTTSNLTQLLTVGRALQAFLKTNLGI